MTTISNSAKTAQKNPALLAGKSETSKKEPQKVLVVQPKAQGKEQEKNPVPSPKPEEKKESTATPTEQTAPIMPILPLSIDEINDKAERLNLLRLKYNTIRDKRKQLDSFTITHDRNNAQLTLVDADGMQISTSNPVSIGKLLKDWMCDLNNGLQNIENEMREELKQFA